MRERQWQIYIAQLRLARRHGLPVILHVRRSADALLKGLRQIGVSGGIAHAFNGSLQQAQAFIALGLGLGFGGAITFERATALRALGQQLPPEALVLETDAPDIPPQWLYRTAEARARGQPQGRNTPAELPRIAQLLADLRGLSLEQLQTLTGVNARRVLPGLERLLT
jgi:TatD DNase family protein